MGGRDWFGLLPDLWEIRVTVGMVVLLMVVYAGQLVVAGTLRDGAAFTVATDLPPRAYIALSPWLHSTHQHFLGNVLGLSLIGGWLERRVNRGQYVWVVLLTGYVANLGPYLIGIGGLGVGASGILNVGWTYFGLEQLENFAETVADESATVSTIGLAFLLYLVGMVIPVAAVLQYVGAMDVAAGVATGTHIVGVGIGGTWGGIRQIETLLVSATLNVSG